MSITGVSSLAEYLGRTHKRIKATGRQAQVVFVNQVGQMEALFEDADIVRRFCQGIEFTEIKGINDRDVIPKVLVESSKVQGVIKQLNEKGYSCAVVELSVGLGMNEKGGCKSICLFHFPATGKFVPMPRPAKPAAEEVEDWMLEGDDDDLGISELI